MLSFQNDLDAAAAKADSTASPPKTNVQVGTPAKPDADGREYFTVANRQGQLRQSTYLLAVLFVIGVICLFLMIKKSAPSSASAAHRSAQQSEQTKIEQAIAKITGVHSQMFSSLEKIVKKFYEFADFEQVDVDDLSKNPFRSDETASRIGAFNKQMQPIVAQSEFELLTIMATVNGNCCMINDKLLYVGDTIDGLTVTQITDRSVSLANNETQITLKLADPF